MRNKLGELVEDYQKKHPNADGSKPTQADIAALAGVNAATLSRYINEHTDSYNKYVIGKLAHFFKLKSPDEIFYFVELDKS